MRIAPKPGDDVRIVWMLAVLIAVGGYYAIDSRYQQAIGVAGEATQQLYERVAANDRIIRQAARLSSLQARVSADIGRFETHRSPAATTSAFLLMLAASAKQFHAQIVGVEPAPAHAAGQTAASAGLTGTDVTIRARGSFRDLLGFVADLSHHGVLLAVSDTQLALANRTEMGTPSPALDATVHATLYHVTPDASN